MPLLIVSSTISEIFIKPPPFPKEFARQDKQKKYKPARALNKLCNWLACNEAPIALRHTLSSALPYEVKLTIDQLYIEEYYLLNKKITI
jgi:hypothetical protein